MHGLHVSFCPNSIQGSTGYHSLILVRVLSMLTLKEVGGSAESTFSDDNEVRSRPTYIERFAEFSEE